MFQSYDVLIFLISPNTIPISLTRAFDQLLDGWQLVQVDGEDGSCARTDPVDDSMF